MSTFRYSFENQAVLQGWSVLEEPERKLVFATTARKDGVQFVCYLTRTLNALVSKCTKNKTIARWIFQKMKVTGTCMAGKFERLALVISKSWRQRLFVVLFLEVYLTITRALATTLHNAGSPRFFFLSTPYSNLLFSLGSRSVWLITTGPTELIIFANLYTSPMSIVF